MSEIDTSLHMAASSLISRVETVSQYNFLASYLEERLQVKVHSYTPELPPFLCRRLLYGQDVSDLTSKSLTFAGIPNAQLKFFQSKHRSIAFIDGAYLIPTISCLPLDGHRLVTKLGRLELIDEALSLLESYFPYACSKVYDWTSLLIWLESSPYTNASLITSSTFPHFPHCTFLSDKALRHIPPNSISEIDSIYSLAENIFHESLHQGLSNSLVFCDMLSPQYRSSQAKKIKVPWRQQYWEPDRVLHAAYVYANLLRLRDDALSSSLISKDQRSWLALSQKDGEEALEYLLMKLEGCKDILTERGRMQLAACRWLSCTIE